ncbi:MAG: rod shape-determining protein MreD [Treponema sp.]|jgi:rod shape-determining protein MreD|nr:rod shape-determining protein MreD [Treponema sp.]
MIRTFTAAIMMLLSVTLFETLVFTNITFLPTLPDLTMLAVMYLSLHNGPLFGETSGFLSGLMLDFLTSGPFGLNCFMRTIIGFLSGLFHRAINTRFFLVHMALGFFGVLLKALLRFFLAFVYPNSNIVTYDIFSIQFASELGLNAAAAPLVFWILSWTRNLLILPKERNL